MPFKPHPDNPDLVIYKPSEYWIPKPWQGLTDEDIEKVYETTNAQTLRPQDRLVIFNFARAIEAKLKEKNT
jgi:hypothetical protein